MQFSLVSFRVKWTFFAIFHTMAQRDLVSFYIFREIEYKIQNVFFNFTKKINIFMIFFHHF